MEPDETNQYSSFYGTSPEAQTPEASSAPWPRPLTADLTPESAESESAGPGNFPISSLFSPTSVKKWISVSWCPRSQVAAACHADAIHIIEGLGNEAKM